VNSRRIAAPVLAFAMLASTVPVLEIPGSKGLDFKKIETGERVEYTHPSYDRASELYNAPNSGTGGGGESYYEIYETSHPEFDDAFPTYDLLAVFDGSYWPWRLHLMAWDADEAEGYDLTMNYTGLLEDADAAIVTDDDAETYARAYMATVNAELLMNRTIVESDDEDWLGYPAEDVKVTLQSDGDWLVDGSLWDPSGGEIVNTTVELGTNEIHRSELTVAATQQGPSTPANEVPQLRQNTTVSNAYDDGTHERSVQLDDPDAKRIFWDTLHTVTWETAATAETFDGITVAVYVDEDATDPTDPDMPQHLADAGAYAYDQLVKRNHGQYDGCGPSTNPDPNMGFHINTTDCEISIHIYPHGTNGFAGFGHNDSACGGAIFVGEDHYSARARDYYGSQSKSDYNATSLSRAVVGHEFTHVLQCHTLWDHSEDELDQETDMPVLRPSWDPVYEGQATYMQTLLAPDLEYEENSYYFSYANDGENGVVPNPSERMCEFKHGYAPYWKLAGTHNMDGTNPYAAGHYQRLMLENSAEMGIHTPVKNANDCDENMPDFVDATLEDPRTDNIHDTHGEVLENLTLELLADDTDAWTYDNDNSDEDGPLDWATHLDPVTNETITSTGNHTPGSIDRDVDTEVGGWGMHYFQIEADSEDLPEEVDITCNVNDTAAWTTQTVRLDQSRSVISTEDCQTAVTVNLTETPHVYVASSRTDPSSGSYSVDVQGAS
jgi:hypothetical protein